MDHVISEYQKWKQQGDTLRAKAKHAMEVKFRELLSDAVTLAEDYHADFGQTLKPPTQVTAFRYTRGARGKGKKAAAAKSGRKVPDVKPDPPPSRPDDAKVIALKKRLATARKKLDAAKAAGQPVKNFEDRVYELEDDLRLAMQ